jgi:hypothetical protein
MEKKRHKEAGKWGIMQERKRKKFKKMDLK